MQTPYSQFSANLKRVRELRTILNFIRSQTTTVLDLSDFLRNELAMAVSALDLYIHDVVREGMLKAFNYPNTQIRTKDFLNALGEFSLKDYLSSVDTRTISINIWFEQEIRKRHGKESFQHPEKIANVIKLISNAQLWEEVSLKLGVAADDLKRDLREIVDRRNKIVHEADLNPTSFTNELWPIDEFLVDNAINLIERIVTAIDAVLNGTSAPSP